MSEILCGDALEVLKTLPDKLVQCCISSPPYYGLRSYLDNDNPDKALEIGLEPTPDEYISRLVAVFREVRRVLRDDGTLFINIGDSYFGSNQTGGKNSMEGSAKRAGRMFSNAQRVAAYGTSDKEQLGYQDHGCLCGNLCDVCRVVYRNHKSHNDGLLVAMLTASLSATIPAHKESLNDHLPTSDSIPQEVHSVHAMQDQAHEQVLFDEQLRDVLGSTTGEFYQQLLDVCLQRDNHALCLLCGHSLPDSTPGFARKSDDFEGQSLHNRDSAPLDDQQMRHNQCTNKACDYCKEFSYQDYTTMSHLKPKDLIGIPWLLAFALRADGWYLRSDLIWNKPNPMPESVTDRCTKSHEYIFMLSKKAQYFYDAEAVKEDSSGLSGGNFSQSTHAARRGVISGGNETGRPADNGTRNKRSVWTISTKPYSGAHFATFPRDLIVPCILAGSKPGDIVLDCFCGSGTTLVTSKELGRNYIGIELSRKYVDNIIIPRLNSTPEVLPFFSQESGRE